MVDSLGGVVFDSFSARVRPRRVRLGVAIARCNSACLGRVAACVCMDASRGRRGESWQRVRGAGSRNGVLRGRRGEGWVVRVSCQHDGGRACRVAGVGLRMRVGVWEDAGQWIRVAGVVSRAF